MSEASTAILRLFRDAGDGFVSGENVSRELKVSRTAVWKQINGLRQSGYVIEAVPSRGYRLLSSPDILSSDEIRDQLVSARIGCHLVCLGTTASTNADAFRLAEEGAEEGTVVVADGQSAGKGRRGRVWTSPHGVNLYCSILLRPDILPHEAPQLTFLSAVAVVRAISLETGLKAEIKWPNDVLLQGKKVAGLLNEMSAETDGINFVILGIGVNLNMSRDQFPDDLRAPATSLLLERGGPVQRARFTALLLNELDRLYADFLRHGFGPVREEWQRSCNAAGREVVVSDQGREMIRGLFDGIDGDGALRLRLPDGNLERIVAGDVRVI